MESIDLMTAMILGLSINAIMATIIYISARKFPKTAAQSMKCWAIGLFCLVFSYFIYSEYYLNTALIIDLLGDLSAVLGIVFMSYAVSLYLRINTVKIYQILVLVTLPTLILTGMIMESYTSSIVVTILCISASILTIAKPLFSAIWKQPTSAKIILFSINTLFLLVMAYRGIDYWLDPRIAFDLKQYYTADILTIIMAVVGPVTATFGFMLMHQEKAYQELARLASIDSLTKIYNRHAIELKARALFKQSIENTSPISVMLIDLDRFKQINDQFGHAAGDNVLYETAQITRRIIGDGNVVGRFGGEEFFVILPGYKLCQAKMKSQQLLNAFRTHRFSFDNNTFQLTASIGVVERNADEISFSATLKRADAAMYDAKRSGRNQAIAV